MPDTPKVAPQVSVVTRSDGTQYIVPRFVWDADREQAAFDVAEGTLTLSAIAERAGINKGTLSNWRQHPDFKARVEQNRLLVREQVLNFGLARKEVRMAHLQERHGKILGAVQARGNAFRDNPELASIPGGESGYVYEHVTANGVEYMIDNKTATLLNDIEKQAAIEQGEWSEGAAPSVAIQIVVPSAAPDASKAPTITIGTVK